MTDSGKWAWYAPGTSGYEWSSPAARSACARPSPAGSGGTALWGAMARGRRSSAGDAEGTALVLEEPQSFWGGVDPATGW